MENRHTPAAEALANSLDILRDIEKLEAAAKLKMQLETCGKIQCFEIPVIDNYDQQEHIIADISISGLKMIAVHIPITLEEEKSEKIAYTEIDLEPDFSLDENLQELYNALIDKILYSDLYQLG